MRRAIGREQGCKMMTKKTLKLMLMGKGATTRPGLAKHCRQCDARLVEGKNWQLSRAKQHDHICVECKKAYDRQYREAHRERRNEYNRQWYEAHREERQVSDRQYREAHREQRAEYSRQYYEAHCEKQRQLHHQWQKANPNKVRDAGRRRRARKSGVTVGPVDGAAIYELYNHTCIYCGATEDLALDHIVALDVGGAHCEDNLVVACRRCNSSKRTRPLEEWLQTQPYSIAWLF